MRVTAVNVKAGDLVQQGEVLAQVDSAQTKQDYEEAQHHVHGADVDQRSTAALRTVADAQTQVQRAKGTLEYLISPEVMYWETQITEGEDKLTAALEVQKALGEAAAKAATDKAAAFLDSRGQAGRGEEDVPGRIRAHDLGIKDDLDVDTYNVPSELEIKKAHLAVTDAEKAFTDKPGAVRRAEERNPSQDTTNAALFGLRRRRSR